MTQQQDKPRRGPLRGLLLAVIVLMLFPTTRHVILDAAGAVATAAVGVVMFAIGGLITLAVLTSPRRR